MSSEKQVEKVAAQPAGATEQAPKKELLHPEEIVTSLILIRHGHTEATEQGLLYTDPSAQLTTRGEEQAKAVALWIARHKPDMVLSSTARRVVDTARIVSQQLDLEPSAYEGLEEWHVGDWEGRSYLDIKKKDPDVYALWSQDPIGNRTPGGESIVDLCERTRHRLEELLIEFEGRKIALVTHSGIIRAILVHALGMDVQNFWRLSIPVGSVSRVDFSKNFATVHFVAVRPELQSS